MKCATIENLLPLYIEDDLTEREVNDVRAHLSSCGRCRETAEEFRASQKLLHTFAAPDFDDEFYESMRGNVLTGIAARTHARPSIFARLYTLFPERPMVAASLALLILFGTLSVIIYHRFSNRGVYMAVFEKSVREINPHEYIEADGNTNTVELISKADEKSPRQSGTTFRNTLWRKVKPTEQTGTLPESLTPESEQAATAQTTTGSKGATNKTPLPQAIARMEIQTSDPNVRIIWLGRQPSK